MFLRETNKEQTASIEGKRAVLAGSTCVIIKLMSLALFANLRAFFKHSCTAVCIINYSARNAW